MKTKTAFFISIIISVFIIIQKNKTPTKRLIHKNLIDNSKVQESFNLSKSERIQLGIAPNKYFEQEFLNEMNPNTGETEPEMIFALQERLNINNKSVPGSNGNDWVERGPNNVPGRTRAMLYDPNDPSHLRVFAGGVSGGLWVNDNIENPNSLWNKVGIPENLAISSITSDVNNPNILYVGTGELYVHSSSANVFIPGNGIWKSVDSGATWTHIFGGATGNTFAVNDASINVTAPASIAGDYPAIKTSNFGAELTTAISGELVIVNDGTSLPNEGCSSLINSATINGKIAIIDRGTCTFTAKVKNAQNAGAIAAIIINSVPTFPFNMAGTDSTITIPALMMGQNDGLVLKNAISNGSVSATLNAVTASYPVGITLIPGKYYINDLVTRNNNGNTEIYAAISSSRHFTGQVLGDEIGVFKSIDQGNSWIKLNLPSNNDGDPYAPNDLLITSDNKIWVSTINSYLYGGGGGTIFSSTDGITFIKKYESTGDLRTQIAAPSNNPNTIYLLIRGGSSSIPVKIKKTTDGFATTPIDLSLPFDPTTPANDFTRGQSFYNLAIAVNPHTDDVMVGGINTFKSPNGGANWFKTSNFMSGAGISPIHADVHNFVFHPTDQNKGLIATDGGVFYVNNWSNAQTNSSAMQGRGRNYNTTQFYKGAIAQRMTSLKILGGSQDNGTNLISNASLSSSSSEIAGGDGMFCFIDKNNQYMVSSYVNNVYRKHDINGNLQYNINTNQNEGFFVNISDLDDNLNVLYSNAHTGSGNTLSGKISRFTLGNTSSVRTDITNSLLTRPITAMKVSPHTSNSTTLFVGTDIGQIFKITLADYFPTWTDLTPEPFDAAFSGSISSINFGATEDDIMVTFHNYGVVNVYFSEDGGLTWQNKEGDLPDLPVKDILMNPLLNNEVIIATDLGVWKTINFLDSQPNWVRSNDGMQNVKVTSFDLRTADNTILASTYGRGLFTGQFTATSTANVEEIQNNVTSLYPAISNGTFSIITDKDYLNTQIKIYSTNGRLVYNKTKNTINRKFKVKIDVDSGVYFVKIFNKSINDTHKIIIN